MSVRESDIPRQAVTDREYRPETEADRKREEVMRRRAALKKTCSEVRSLMGRLETKILDIEAACESPLI